ncbi:hypothetical protein [Acetobacter fallax]|uniref:Uncharacterized protein n=1 Tax=Acetobacter fallax TaxID=1737473 RepID=A0ABX0KAJ7_9PROT|nr:hypothetical protein [Acetobacter fallax]NHO33459.1 hypothetical protein [Acetobacter fallax]NHO37062.1 hypothetical protein [Acetobacter fallax]
MVIEALPEGRDVVLRGNNFDTTLTADAVPGLSPCIISFTEAGLRENAEKFVHMDMVSQPFRPLGSAVIG